MRILRFSLWMMALAALATSCHTASRQEPQMATSNTPIPAWSKNAVIYEVNIRQYTEAGTFKAFAEHLPRLKDLGVDVLWLMPVFPIGETNRKGTLGSYYSIRDYKAINPEFGNLDDFKTLVNQAHQLGLKVILDWAANHTAWDNAWVTLHPEWYAKDSTGQLFSPYDWTDVVQLDYKNPDLHQNMIEALKYWVTETDIDGYRCDMAGMVPLDFWEAARLALDKIKPVYMLAEDEDNLHYLTNAFNANYGWSLHHTMNAIAKGEKMAPEIKAYYQQKDTLYPIGTYPMHFTSNHDENSWSGTEYERMGDAAKTFAALTFVIKGIPMIYTGQEAGLNKRLEFFEKNSIDWSDLSMTTFYQSLIQLKKGNPALWNGAAGGDMQFVTASSEDQVLCFTRTKDENTVLAIFNLSGKSATVFADLKQAGVYADYFTGTDVTLPLSGLLLQPWEYLVIPIHP